MSNTLELLKQNPHTTTLIKAWYLGKMLESFKDESVPEDFKDMMRAQPIDDDKISKMIDGAPRLLFDFFDENDIIITTFPSMESWSFAIDEITQGNPYNNRKEAEYAAISEAFELLDNKIKES